MSDDIIIKIAQKSEIEFINSWYRDIGFKESDYSKELTILVNIGKKPVGVGRLQNIDDENAELGGIYVLPEFRGKKIARRIVEHLLDNATSYKKVYCLPFSHLKDLYKSMGFKVEDDISNVPDKVLCKHNWCNKTYKSETLLFSLTVK